MDVEELRRAMIERLQVKRAVSLQEGGTGLPETEAIIVLRRAKERR
jgi:hypothetical protein